MQTEINFGSSVESNVPGTCRRCQSPPVLQTCRLLGFRPNDLDTTQALPSCQLIPS